MAAIEKVFLDYFYLYPDIETEADFNSLRINREMFFKQIDEKEVLFSNLKMSLKPVPDRQKV